jgi:SAM-dependent methyltransferase
MSGIAVARTSAPNIRFEVLGVDDAPDNLGSAAFDAVVSLEVIEHLVLPRNLPRFAARVLKPGGYLIVSTPYHGYLKNLAIVLLGRWDAHHDPLWDGGHIKFWSARTLRSLMEHEGFVFERFLGAGRFPWFWKSMVLVFRRVGRVTAKEA